jgi:hypothetical protein
MAELFNRTNQSRLPIRVLLSIGASSESALSASTIQQLSDGLGNQFSIMSLSTDSDSV